MYDGPKIVPTRGFPATERTLCMQRTLAEHIRFLEARIFALAAQMERPISAEEDRNRLQAEILIAEEALAYYKKGYELEQKIA
jgi:hypothetical protein